MLKGIGFLPIALVAAAAGYCSFADVFKVDSCLDGGGAWDYAKRACRNQ